MSERIDWGTLVHESVWCVLPSTSKLDGEASGRSALKEVESLPAVRMVEVTC